MFRLQTMFTLNISFVPTKLILLPPCKLFDQNTSLYMVKWYLMDLAINLNEKN